MLLVVQGYAWWERSLVRASTPGDKAARAEPTGWGIGVGRRSEGRRNKACSLPPLQQRPRPLGGWRDRRPHVGALPLRPDPSRSTDAKDVGRLV